MPDDKVVLAVMPSPAVAHSLAADLRAAFDERIAYLRAHDEVPADAITPPLELFAQQHGFAWDSEDCFSWDDDPLDPTFDITSVGPLFLATHAAAYSIAEIGLERLARQRGATTVLFWSHDLTPFTLTLHFTSDLGVRWFNAQWETIFRIWGDELQLLDGTPPETAEPASIVHFTGPDLSAFIDAPYSSIVTRALRAVANRPDVEASLRLR